jgi:hypothetical protein
MACSSVNRRAAETPASPVVSPALTFMASTKIAQSTMRLIQFIRMLLEKVFRQEKREIMPSAGIS